MAWQWAVGLEERCNPERAARSPIGATRLPMAASFETNSEKLTNSGGDGRQEKEPMRFYPETKPTAGMATEDADWPSPGQVKPHTDMQTMPASLYPALLATFQADSPVTYAVTWDDGAYQAANPDQRLRIRFTQNGVHVEPE